MIITWIARQTGRQGCLYRLPQIAEPSLHQHIEDWNDDYTPRSPSFAMVRPKILIVLAIFDSSDSHHISDSSSSKNSPKLRGKTGAMVLPGFENKTVSLTSVVSQADSSMVSPKDGHKNPSSSRWWYQIPDRLTT